MNPIGTLTFAKRATEEDIAKIADLLSSHGYALVRHENDERGFTLCKVGDHLAQMNMVMDLMFGAIQKVAPQCLPEMKEAV